MPSGKLQVLTKAFALAIVRLVDELPNRRAGWVIGDQLMRSGTSVGANYRSACRARSRRDFIAKMGIVEEEADESEYWLELAVDAGLVDLARVAQLRDDARHIVAMTVLSIRRARGTPLAAPHATRRTLGLTGRA
ncbi:MAG: four helix bundle protein [Gemmatimonadetes bacterium]|nr:MAG: four helix bundle protein [Gemmatimonadota bacterium]